MTDSQPASKSAAKREQKALQALAATLLEMDPQIVADLDLSETLAADIALGHKLKKGARARHIRRLARVLGAEPDDVATIRRYVDDDESRQRLERKRFKVLERMRADLLAEKPPAWEALTQQSSGERLDKIRALVTQHNNAVSERERKTCFRALFRALANDVSKPE